MVDRPPSSPGSKDGAEPSEAWQTLRDGIDLRRTQASVLGRLFGGAREQTRIGRFEVRGNAGQGEMGRVYVATDPELNRDVAIKLIRARPGDAKEREQRTHRLRAEAQALAKVQHPNVIAVHEVGRHEDDVFIVMEYVRGPSLRSWVTQSDRSRTDVLSVMIGAGRGLAAAHAKGLVHRDFKPDNVLVAEGERAVVLDFGLVHAADPTALDQGGLAPQMRIDDRLTRTGAVVGTPAYMAPEQMEGRGADPRSDQFSFCATLYELLHGRRPFCAPTAGAHIEAVKRGAPPSTARLPRWLSRAIETGLQAEPQHRFSSMDELLVQLERGTRPRKTARVLGVGAVAGAAAIAVMSNRSSAPGPQCDQGQLRVAAIWGAGQADALTEAFEASDVVYAPGLAPRITTELDEYAARWASMVDDACSATHLRGEQSETLLDLRNACLARHLHEFEAVVEMLSAADAKVIERSSTIVAGLPSADVCAQTEELLRGVALPTDSQARAQIDAASKVLARAGALYRAGRFDDASPLVTQVLAEEVTETYPPLHAEALLQRAQLAYERGDEGFERAYLDGVAVAESHHLDRLAARLWRYLAEALSDEVGDSERVAAHLERYEVAVNRLGGPPYHRGLLERVRGRRALNAREPSRAVTHLGSALELLRPLDEGAAAGTLMDLGGAYWQLGQHDEAVVAFRDAAQMYRQLLGPQHPNTASAMSNEGAALVVLGKQAEAIEILTEAHEIRRQVFGPDHRYVAVTANALASAHYSLGSFAQALPMYEEAVRINEVALGADHPRLGPPLANVARTLSHLGRHDEAVAAAGRAVDIVETARGAEHAELVTLLSGLGHTLIRAHRFEEALEVQRRAVQVGRAALGDKHVEVAYARHALALTLIELERFPEALLEARTAESQLSAVFEEPHPQHAVSLTTLGKIEAHLGNTQVARAHLRQALEVFDKTETASEDVETARAELAKLP